MAQVTIYLDDDTEQRVKTAAKSTGLSVSRWICFVINEKTDKAWPKSIVDAAGAFPDFPLVEELHLEAGVDSPREQW